MGDLKKRLIKRKILEMRDLPSLSKHVRNLMVMLRDPDADIDEIVLEINRDQSLVAQILRLVNSGYYSLPHQIDTVEQAISLVGFSKVWDLLMSTSVMTLMSNRERHLWSHSYSASMLAKEIMTQEKIRCSGKVPLAMLMHDIGKLVLLTYNDTSYRLVESMSEESREPQHNVEEKRIGVSHAETGCWLLEAWELEREYCDLILHHHDQEVDPEIATEIALMQIVDYCDSIARRKPFHEPYRPVVIAGGLEKLNLAQWSHHQQLFVKEANKLEGIP